MAGEQVTVQEPRAAGDDKIVHLPADTSSLSETAPASRPGRLHGLFIAGMALSAFVGIVAMFGFITIRWPADTGRFVMGVFFVAVIVFLVCASAAVFAAARDTYAARDRDHLD